MKKSIATLLSLCLVLVAVFAVSADAATKRGPRGKQGPRGLRGLTGPAGPQGPQGPAGPAGSAAVTGTASITRIDYRAIQGFSGQSLYNANGLQLVGTCDGGGLMALRAIARAHDGVISAYQIGFITGTNAPTIGALGSGPDAKFVDPDFDDSDSDTVFSVNNQFRGSGHIDFASGAGNAITVNAVLMADAPGIGPNPSVQGDCVFVGTAINA